MADPSIATFQGERLGARRSTKSPRLLPLATNVLSILVQSTGLAGAASLWRNVNASCVERRRQRQTGFKVGRGRWSAAIILAQLSAEISSRDSGAVSIIW